MAELIVYFSRGDENYVNGMVRTLERGNTEVVAYKIKELTGADIFRIEQLQAYAKDYNECIAQAQADQKRNARPELKSYPESIAPYEVLYLGYPNYWGTMPMAVFTFLEHFDFTGKIIKPFCTHEGSQFGSSVKDIIKLCPGADVQAGFSIYGGSVLRAEKELKQWL